MIGMSNIPIHNYNISVHECVVSKLSIHIHDNSNAHKGSIWKK